MFEDFAAFDEKRILFGAALSIAHQRGKAGSLLTWGGKLDLDYIDEMLQQAHPDGLYHDDPVGRRRWEQWRCRRVYRGGTDDPSYLAGGMSWTADLAMARHPSRAWNGDDSDLIVIATRARKRDVLACFEYEDEVVLIPCDDREFVIVEKAPVRAGV